jgi:hypothetical protein
MEKMRLIRFIYRIFKNIYKLLVPKFIRKYTDSKILLFLNLLREIKFKSTGQKYRLVKNIKDLDIKYKLFESIKNRTSVLNTQTLLNKEGNFSYINSVENPVLDINLYLFKDITVLGGTDALINKTKIYHQELLAMDEHHDLKQHDIFFFDKKNKKNIFLHSTKIRKLDDERNVYISLLKEHSLNYYHWMTEIMPRAIFTCQTLKYDNTKMVKGKKIVFLIDEHIPKQCLEALTFCIDLPFTTEVVYKNELLTCNNLIYCSPFWQSLDNTTGNIPKHEEFFLDMYALKLVHDAIQNKYSQIDSEKKEPKRKIYLQRKPTQMRSIINYQKVENFMIEESFEILDTSNLSFIEQVKLFSEAKIVIGASGATFTNLLYMQNNTVAINFYPSHPATNHGIFQPLADVSGVKLIHYKTIPVDDKSLHSNFMVDLNIIQNILKDLDI